MELVPVMESVYPEFPPTQFYILLSVSVVLLGIVFSNLPSSNQSLRGAEIFFLGTWLHLSLSVLWMTRCLDGVWFYGYAIPSSFGLGFSFTRPQGSCPSS